VRGYCKSCEKYPYLCWLETVEDVARERVLLDKIYVKVSVTSAEKYHQKFERFIISLVLTMIVIILMHVYCSQH
jgi:hypothetical protein